MTAEEDAPLTDAQRALRAQLLATEHWSLLASRSTTQSEVLTRIAIFLTLVSAGLVTLGFLGQASGFHGWFGAAALAVLFLLALLGLITQLRAFNTAGEDLMYVIAMNRLRAAYLDLDPGVAPYLLTSAHDDQVGAETTYHVFYRRGISPVLGSSMMIITVVEATVVGLLCGSTAWALAAPSGVALTIGIVVAIVVIAASMVLGYRQYRRAFRSYQPLRPTGGP